MAFNLELHEAAALTKLVEKPMIGIQEIPNKYPDLIPYLNELQTNLPSYSFHFRSLQAQSSSVRRDLTSLIQSYDDAIHYRILNADDRETKRHNMQLLTCAVLKDPELLLSFRHLARDFN